MTPVERASLDVEIQRHERTIVRWLALKLGDPDAADDIAQSVFERVLSFAEKGSITNPRGLMFKTATNLARNEIKRRGQLRRRFIDAAFQDGDDPISNHPSGEPSPETCAAFREELALVKETITRLPWATRKAFTMSRFDGASYKEIACELGVSVSSVEKYIIAALQELRRAVDRRTHEARAL